MARPAAPPANEKSRIATRFAPLPTARNRPSRRFPIAAAIASIAFCARLAAGPSSSGRHVPLSRELISTPRSARVYNFNLQPDVAQPYVLQNTLPVAHVSCPQAVLQVHMVQSTSFVLQSTEFQATSAPPLTFRPLASKSPSVSFLSLSFFALPLSLPVFLVVTVASCSIEKLPFSGRFLFRCLPFISARHDGPFPENGLPAVPPASSGVLPPGE